MSHCPTSLWLCTAVGGCDFCFCWVLLLLLVCFFASENRSLVGEQVDVVNLQEHTMCSGHSMLLIAYSIVPLYRCPIHRCPRFNAFEAVSRGLCRLNGVPLYRCPLHR
jgi:hypothetical protein